MILLLLLLDKCKQAFTLNLIFEAVFMSTAALYISEGGVWDGTRLYPGLADRDGPVINQHWAFLRVWRPGQNQTAEGTSLAFITACVLHISCDIHLWRFSSASRRSSRRSLWTLPRLTTSSSRVKLSWKRVSR